MDLLSDLRELAAFVRDRLADVGELLTPRVLRPDEVPTAARYVTSVVAGAAAPFAPTSYARARLLRQLHASGLLTADEADRAEQLLPIAR